MKEGKKKEEKKKEKKDEKEISNEDLENVNGGKKVRV